MKIEILGTGCAKCNKLEEMAREAVAESGSGAEIVKVKDLNAIMGYGVMITPALVVDGEVKSAGKLPSKEEIRKWIS